MVTGTRGSTPNPLEFTEDDEHDDGAVADWYQTEATKQLEQLLGAGVVVTLQKLVQATSSCTDPAIRDLAGQYAGAKVALLHLQRHGKRDKDAKLNIKVQAP